MIEKSAFQIKILAVEGSDWLDEEGFSSNRVTFSYRSIQVDHTWFEDELEEKGEDNGGYREDHV